MSRFIALVSHVRKKPAQRPIPGIRQVVQNIFRIHTACHELSPFTPHFVQQPLASFINECHVAKIHHRFAAV
jgi:hypothetical protein